ncbi:MAG TPA: metalloregulator ArsR/SmtB family transcription factor [Woeseiaceae bacterium]|nr:metalloregulator ArsR/SmtB family transcription factor [Woeseiaceae bacterium]
MVEQSSAQLDVVFGALADPTRRALLQSLAAGDKSIGELAAPFEMSLEAVSKHIRVLERAGLVKRSIQGRTHLCRLDARPMHGGLEWIRHYEEFWNRRLDALDELLRREDGAAGKARTRTKAGRNR